MINSVRSFPVKNTNIFNQKINTEQLFEYAIDLANENKNKKAMEVAREALFSAKQNNLYLAIYIHSFMAALSLEKNDYGTSRIHIYNAMNRLNKEHYNYHIDRVYLDSLLALVIKKDVESKQLKFEALVA